MSIINSYMTLPGTSSGKASVLEVTVVTRAHRDPRQSAEYQNLANEALAAVKKRPAPTPEWSNRIAAEITAATD